MYPCIYLLSFPQMIPALCQHNLPVPRSPRSLGSSEPLCHVALESFSSVFFMLLKRFTFFLFPRSSIGVRCEERGAGPAHARLRERQLALPRSHLRPQSIKRTITLKLTQLYKPVEKNTYQTVAKHIQTLSNLDGEAREPGRRRPRILEMTFQAKGHPYLLSVERLAVLP